MLYALQLTQRQAVQRIMQLVRRIEKGYPGGIVWNFHPRILLIHTNSTMRSWPWRGALAGLPSGWGVTCSGSRCLSLYRTAR
jgi:hypothetical protein